MAGSVFTQSGVTPAGDRYWALDAPTIGEMGWRYLVVITADAIHVCKVETKAGFYDRLRKLTEGVAYAEVFRVWSRWFPMVSLETLSLDSITGLEEVELTHEFTLVSQPTGGKAKRVSISTPGVPLYHELFDALHQRLAAHAEPKSEVASAGQLARGPVIALVAGLLVSVVLISMCLVSDDAPVGEARHGGILLAAKWLTTQIGFGGVACVCGAILLAPGAWLAARVRSRPPKQVVDVTPKPS